MLTRAERLAGGIWGLLVGDALGVPYEFHAAAELPPPHAIEMEPPPELARAHVGTPPGTFSDDGAHALCLLASLLQHRRLDPEDLMRRLTNWYELGYLAVDDRVFDVGMQTSRALSAFRSGVPALSAGPAGEHDNGNGSLMRVLPLALWHRGPDAALVADARTQSRLTHGHPRAQLCCALYCLWARRILDGDEQDSWAHATAILRALVDDADRRELDLHLRPDAAPSGSGTGYVVDTLSSARMVQSAGDYESIVRAAISLGNDTDTTACVAGGIAGLRLGLDSIPPRWREALRGQDLFTPLLTALLNT
jgi:ADP-ribosyl-[dinitrogen reductase] hydrolase